MEYNNQIFPKDVNDFTMELNKDFTNWIVSCNQQGSPGSYPLLTCLTDSPTISPSEMPTESPIAYGIQYFYVFILCILMYGIQSMELLL